MYIYIKLFMTCDTNTTNNKKIDERFLLMIVESPPTNHQEERAEYVNVSLPMSLVSASCCLLAETSLQVNR